MVIADLNCPSNARAARTSVLPFRLNAFEQFGVRSIEVVSEFHRCFQSFGVHFETFSQFPGSGIVKEREVLIEIWHNQFVAQFLIMRHAAESPPDDRFIIAQRSERLYIEQLNPARLKERGKIARIVIGRKDEWMQRRHLAGVQRTPKFRGLLFFLGSVNFSALNSCAQCSLDRCQDLIASFRLLLMLLITVEPKCRINSDKNENQFRRPAGQPPTESFRPLVHRLIFSLLQRVPQTSGSPVTLAKAA